MNLNFWKCWAMLLKCVDNSNRGGLSLTFLLIVSPTNSPLHIEDTIPHDTTQSDTVLSGSIEFSFTPLSHNWSKQTLLKEHIWCSTYRLPQHLDALKQWELSTKKAHSLKCPPTRCVCTHTHTNTPIVWHPYPPTECPSAGDHTMIQSFILKPNVLFRETKNRHLNPT